MKYLLALLLLGFTKISFSQTKPEDLINKIIVNKDDSTVWIMMNTVLGENSYGYESPDVNSKKMLCLTIFSDDLKNNPDKCIYGACQSPNANKKYDFKFSGTKEGFTELIVYKKGKKKEKDRIYCNLKHIIYKKKS
tara:strand:+ start:293 stop:700 length:408 start_codon:yes stop_codon:yes gene_type:complete